VRDVISTLGNQRIAIGKKNPNILAPKAVLLAILKLPREGLKTQTTLGKEEL
jgi:hypothetical protein